MLIIGWNEEGEGITLGVKSYKFRIINRKYYRYTYACMYICMYIRMYALPIKLRTYILIYYLYYLWNIHFKTYILIIALDDYLTTIDLRTHTEKERHWGSPWCRTCTFLYSKGGIPIQKSNVRWTENIFLLNSLCKIRMIFSGSASTSRKVALFITGAHSMNSGKYIGANPKSCY